MAEITPKQHATLNEIMRVNPVLHLATIAISGMPHSTALRFAPDQEGRRLFWLARPSDTSPRDIADTAHYSMPQFRSETSLPTLLTTAPVSGSISIPPKWGRPLVGLTFTGKALRTDPPEVEEGMERLESYGVFSQEKLEELYLSPDEGGKGTHAMYTAIVEEWCDILEEQPPLLRSV